MTPNGGVGAQGIAPTPTELKPLTLAATAPAGTTKLTAAVSGTAQLDAVLLQPLVSHLGMTGRSGAYDLYVSASNRTIVDAIPAVGRTVTISSYNASGALIASTVGRASTTHIVVAPGGFTVVSTRSR